MGSFTCNITDSTKTGVYFGGNNLETKFRGNEMRKHNIGLYLNNTAVIDTQSHAGNMWTAALYNSGYGAWNENWQPYTNLTKSLFIVNPALGVVYNPNIPLVGSGGIPNDQGWFFPDTLGTIFECGGYLFCDRGHSNQKESGSGDLKEAIARDSVITTEFIPESKMIAQMDLFEALKKDSVLKSSNIVFENFVVEKENQSIGYLYKTKEKLKELENYSLQQSAALQTADSLINIYISSISELDSITAADSTVDNIQARENLLSSLNVEITVKGNVINQVQTANVSKINDAKSFNLFVFSNSLPDENMKFINSINTMYLLHGKDKINAYYQQILSIAEQCPFAGGKAVYMARSFVSLFNDSVIYDDDNNCLQQGYYRLANETTSSNAVSEIEVLPNPADNYVDVILKKEYDGICKISITDVYSKVLFKQSFDCSKKQYRVNTSNFLSGIYSVQISVNDSTIHVTKLIIAK